MDAGFTGLLSFGASDMLTTAGSPVTLVRRRGGTSPSTAVLTIQSGDLSAILSGERITTLAHALVPLSLNPSPGDTLIAADSSRWQVDTALASPGEAVYRLELTRKQ